MHPAAGYYSGHATPQQQGMYGAQYGAYSGHTTPMVYSGVATPMQGALSGHATPMQVPYQTEIPEDLGTWEERIHPENGHKFFYNTSTGVSQYELPAWVDATDPASGRVYYFNTATRVSTYDRPSDFVPIKRLPRAQIQDSAVEDPYAAMNMHQPRSGAGSAYNSRPTSGFGGGPSAYSLPASRGSAREVFRGAASGLQPKAVGSDDQEGDSIECVLGALRWWCVLCVTPRVVPGAGTL